MGAVVPAAIPDRGEYRRSYTIPLRQRFQPRDHALEFHGQRAGVQHQKLVRDRAVIPQRAVLEAFPEFIAQGLVIPQDSGGVVEFVGAGDQPDFRIVSFLLKIAGGRECFSCRSDPPGRDPKTIAANIAAPTGAISCRSDPPGRDPKPSRRSPPLLQGRFLVGAILRVAIQNPSRRSPPLLQIHRIAAPANITTGAVL